AADDLVAEVFLVAFRQRGGYDTGRPSARPWLYGIATRLISRRRRDEVRFFRAIARTGVDPAADPVAEPVADEGIRRADARTLHRARARMIDGGAPGLTRPRPRWLRLPGTRGKLALTGLAGLAAAATAAAVAMALTAPGGGQLPAGTASPAVKQMAYRAAAAA